MVENIAVIMSILSPRLASAVQRAASHGAWHNLQSGRVHRHSETRREEGEKQRGKGEGGQLEDPVQDGRDETQNTQGESRKEADPGPRAARDDDIVTGVHDGCC